MLQAKVKADSQFNPVTAFGGYEFVRTEYRPVPAGFEAAAEAHPYLEVLEVKEVVAEPAAEKPARGKGKGKAAQAEEMPVEVVTEDETPSEPEV